MTAGQAAKHDFLKDKTSQKQALADVQKQLKTKNAQTQKQILQVKTATTMLQAEYEQLNKSRIIRGQKC